MSCVVSKGHVLCPVASCLQWAKKLPKVLLEEQVTPGVFLSLAWTLKGQNLLFSVCIYSCLSVARQTMSAVRISTRCERV